MWDRPPGLSARGARLWRVDRPGGPSHNMLAGRMSCHWVRETGRCRSPVRQPLLPASDRTCEKYAAAVQLPARRATLALPKALRNVARRAGSGVSRISRPLRQRGLVCQALHLHRRRSAVAPRPRAGRQDLPTEFPLRSRTIRSETGAAKDAGCDCRWWNQWVGNEQIPLPPPEPLGQRNFQGTATSPGSPKKPMWLLGFIC